MDARQIVLSPNQPVAGPAGLSIGVMRAGFRALSHLAPGLAARAAERLWLTPPRPRIRDDARAFLATGRRIDVWVNARRVSAWRWGSGPGVLLMHGWGGYGGQMLAFVEPLTKAGFQAIVIDAPAHGASGPSRLGSRRSTLFDFADALRGVAAETSSLAGVVAHSGGCTAAAWALHSSPDWRVPAMVFVAPMASPARYRALFQRAVGFSDEVMAKFVANTEQQFGFRWDDIEVPAMAARMETPPLLVVHDREDRETSWAEGAAIAESWPSARLHTTTGLGHNRVLRDPAVVADVVRFIRGTG